KKASDIRKAAALPHSRQDADSLRASERIELDLNEGSISRLRIDFGKRGLIRGPRFGVLSRRNENIASKVRVNARKRFVGLGVEHPQRIVVLLVVEQRLRQPKARDRLELVFPGVVDHPLQLAARARFVSSVVEDLRVEQCGTRRIRGAPETVDDLRRRILGLRGVLFARRLTYRLIEHACLL